MHWWAATVWAWAADRDQRGEDHPFGVGRVRRVPAGAGAGQMIVWRGRVGGCADAGDQGQTHTGPCGRARLVWLPVLVPQGPTSCQPTTPDSPIEPTLTPNQFPDGLLACSLTFS